MHRLALLERGLRLVPRPKADALPPQLVNQPRRRIVGTSFAVGLACGGLLGVATLLALPAHPRPALPLHGPSAQHVVPEASPAPALEIPLPESRDGKTPFPLYVTGADRTAGLRVTLRDLPEPVRLSGGERLDEHTWQLTLADLDGLEVTLGAGTPEAFAVTIDVTSAAGIPAARTIAHVRLAPRSETATTPALSPATIATIEDLLRRPVEPPQPRPATARPARIDSAPHAEARTAAAPPRGPLPEGISTLGGPRLEGPAFLPSGAEDRKVWWHLPAPTTSWAPFADRASGN
jgi:hypothetical protein